MPPLPEPRALAALVLLVLGFGVNVGVALEPRADAAYPIPRIVVVLGPSATPAPPPPTGSGLAKPHHAPTGSGLAKPHHVPVCCNARPDPVVTPDPTPSPTPTPTPQPPDIKHVVVVWLAGHPVDETFADDSPATYLTGELRPKGVLLDHYLAPGADARAGGLALLAGRPDAHDGAPNLLARLADAGRVWRTYASAPADTCAQPDHTGARNPALAVNTGPDCSQTLLGMDRLAGDLGDPLTAPNLAIVVPSACEAGEPGTCPAGEPDGLARADAFLKQWAPQVLDSPAFDDGGLLVVAFDHGGRTGALLVAKQIEAGATRSRTAGPAAVLRTVADAFGVKAPGRSARATPFGARMFAAR